MRIAVDISSATPGRTGIGTYTFELARRLVRSRDHDWVLLFNSLRQPPPDLPEFRAPHVTLVRRRIPGPVLLKAWQYLDLPDIETLTQGPVDLFHAPATYVPPQRRGVRVTTVHDLYFLEPGAHKAPLGGRYLEWVVRHRLPGLHAILTDAPSVARQVEEMLGHSSGRPVIPIPLGVDPRFFEPVPESRTAEVRARHALPPAPFLLSLGGGEVRKNGGRLQAAFRQWRQERCQSDIFLLRIGSGGQPTARESGIIELPYVPREDLVVLYRMATALLFPSLHEGFGLPVLEAMACGTPVLTSPTVAVTEYLPPGSVGLCDPTDTDSIAAMLRESLGDPERLAALAAAGPEIAIRFTWEETARQTLQAYEQITQARRP